jgi:holo-[acyl-carrier protein] synthase
VLAQCIICAVTQRVGIDLTSVSAVREAVVAHGDRYLERVYTARERADCGHDPARLAGRFAAKEAAIKVLRPGPSTALPWSEIEVVREPDGHVELVLAGRVAERAREQCLEGFAVSLTHDGDAACAVVVAQHGPGGTSEMCR